MRAGNLCHQLIFMNHASGAVAPPDTEVIQVGNAISRRANAAVKLASRSWSTNFTLMPASSKSHEQVPGLLDYPRLDRVFDTYTTCWRSLSGPTVAGSPQAWLPA